MTIEPDGNLLAYIQRLQGIAAASGATLAEVLGADGLLRSLKANEKTLGIMEANAARMEKQLTDDDEPTTRHGGRFTHN